MKHIRLFVLVGLFLALIAVSPGCAPAAKPMEAEADFYGFITEINPDREGDILGQISVESHSDKIVNKCTVTITNETLIFRQDGDNLSQANFEALEDKQWVKVWFTGPILGSFPMRGTAGQVVIEQ